MKVINPWDQSDSQKPATNALQNLVVALAAGVLAGIIVNAACKSDTYVTIDVDGPSA